MLILPWSQYPCDDFRAPSTLNQSFSGLGLRRFILVNAHVVRLNLDPGRFMPWMLGVAASWQSWHTWLIGIIIGGTRIPIEDC